MPCPFGSPRCAVRLTQAPGRNSHAPRDAVPRSSGPLPRSSHIASTQHYSRTHIVGVDERLNVVGHQQVDRLCDLLDAPVPPFDSQKGFDLLGWESETGNPGWISSHDRIRRNILAHHTSGTDHHPVTQGDAREDQAFMSDPYIVANSDVPLGHRGIRSEVSEIVTKRRIRSQPIGGHVIHAVLTAKKYAAAISDRAELADP